ncbi:MAG: aminopeptidase [Gammaproteobacteria bacterium]|nr:aminopeptidase [Gammaproteobacteria bacterium]
MKIIFVFLLTLFLSACSHLGYYWQAVGGQMEIFSKQQSLEDILANPETSPELRKKLEHIQHVRSFASQKLHLPENDSYKSYVDVKRPYLVWNVFAAPELSLEPFQSCFLVTGCLAYRGYFNKEDAEQFADELKEQGYDVFVAGISAYSTLGWFDDPVPNTILHYSDIHIAGLIFHELAHQKFYVKDDTAFNESFAMAVELAGVKQWLQQTGDASVYDGYRNDKQRREQFIDLLMETRKELKQLYQSDVKNKKENKSLILKNLKARFKSLKQSWGGDKTYDNWMKQELNNAHFISIGLYHQYVPAFERLRGNNNNWSDFFKQVAEIGAMPVKERKRQLENLMNGLSSP